ncbi:MAG: hypothetical protein RMJ88_13460 [Thermogemmata sp.]|nr:hypothetical protein [Thermogemmata sp.]
MAGQGLPSAPPDSQPTRSSKRVYALIILASVTVIAVVTVTYVIFLLLGTQPNIPIGEGQQAKGDGNPASTGQHGKETALSKEDGGAGKKDVLPPIPAIPPPPKLPSLDPEVAQTVMAEKRAQLIGTWHTDLPYPITLTYQPDGQVILILKPPQGASRQIEARWKVTEAVTRQVLAIEWEGPSQRRQRFDVVFELGGDIQHPIWGQPRLIPRFSKKE